jgi:hypothetical protein
MRPTESHGTHGSAKALPSREVGYDVMGHVAALDPSRAGRQDPEPWDTWQRWSPSEQGGRIQSCGTHPEPWDTWQRWSPPEQGGRIQSCGTHGNAGALLSRETGTRAT